MKELYPIKLAVKLVNFRLYEYRLGLGVHGKVERFTQLRQGRLPQTLKVFESKIQFASLWDEAGSVRHCQYRISLQRKRYIVDLIYFQFV